MAVIGINYTGGGSIWNDDETEIVGSNPIFYESVYLHTEKGEFVFNSGDFPADWYNAKKKFYREIYQEEPFLSGSSTVDHFIMDGAPYHSAYLHYDAQNNGNPILEYADKATPFEVQFYISKGDELFVDDGTFPTFEELKERAQLKEQIN